MSSMVGFERLLLVTHASVVAIAKPHVSIIAGFLKLIWFIFKVDDINFLLTNQVNISKSTYIICMIFGHNEIVYLQFLFVKFTIEMVT